MKQAFLLSEQGVCNIYFVRDQNPRIQWLIDLGIPNFSVFMLELPIPEDNPAHAEIIFNEGMALLLDQIKVFLEQHEFGDDAGILKAIVKAVRATDIDYGSPELFYGYEIMFPLSTEFYNRVMDRLVRQKVAGRDMDISNSVWKGPTVGGRYVSDWESRVVKQKDQKALQDAKKIIDRYKQTIYKNTPGPMYVILYDRAGMPRGVSRVTNKGLTKWAGDVWKAYWIQEDGETVEVPKGYEHWEAANDILSGELGMEFDDPILDATREALRRGWIRVSWETGTIYMEVNNWTKSQLYMAQEFVGSIGGIRDVVMEDHGGPSKLRNAMLGLDEFLVLDNPNQAFRLDLSRTSALRSKKIAKTKCADEFAKVPKKLLDVIQDVKEIEPGGDYDDEAQRNLGEDLKAYERLSLLRKRTKLPLPVVGEGSSRIAVGVDGKLVIKFALNGAGRAQNRMEYRAYEKVEDCSMITRIFYYDEDFDWLICERVLREPDNEDFLQYIQPGKGFDLDDAEGDYLLELFVMCAEGMELATDMAVVDPVAFKSLKFLIAHGIKPNDLGRSEQWGVVSRRGQEYPVVVDYGYTDEVSHSYYNQRSTYTGMHGSY